MHTPYIICIIYNSQNGTESQPHPWWQEGTPPPTDHIIKEVIICTMYVQFNLTQKAYHIQKSNMWPQPSTDQIVLYSFPKKGTFWIAELGTDYGWILVARGDPNHQQIFDHIIYLTWGWRYIKHCSWKKREKNCGSFLFYRNKKIVKWKLCRC